MTSDIWITLGEASGGVPLLALNKAPHILVAGMTGSGKSVFTNSLISEVMERYGPAQARFLLIDPKRVEFAPYRGARHLVSPPLYELDDVRNALGWANEEMSARFTILETYGLRDIEGTGMPRLIIVIDELANLILADRKLEQPIVTIASMGRAAGIHLVLATQRPSADVVTGLIRANVPTRICMSVVTSMESRIILDESGAEDLTEPGMMLARLPGAKSLRRIKGRYVSDEDIDRIVAGVPSVPPARTSEVRT